MLTFVFVCALCAHRSAPRAWPASRRRKRRLRPAVQSHYPHRPLLVCCPDRIELFALEDRLPLLGFLWCLSLVALTATNCDGSPVVALTRPLTLICAVFANARSGRGAAQARGGVGGQERRLDREAPQTLRRRHRHRRYDFGCSALQLRSCLSLVCLSPGFVAVSAYRKRSIAAFAAFVAFVVGLRSSWVRCGRGCSVCVAFVA